MFRHLSRINFAMYVLTMNSLKEVMEESTNSGVCLPGLPNVAWVNAYRKQITLFVAQ